MNFAINLNRLELVISASDTRPLTGVSLKRGDAAEFKVVFIQDNVRTELPDGSVLTFCAKAVGKYDADPPPVLCQEWVKSGSGTTAEYTGSPSFNTDELNTLFNINDDDSDDPETVPLMAEFSWQVDEGDPTSIKTFRCVVENDVFRGTETNPTLPDVDLESVPMLSAGQTITVDANTSDSWSLTSGSASAGESSPSYANTTAGAAGRAALINAASPAFDFWAYNIANVIHLKAKVPGTAGNGIGLTLVAANLTAGDDTLSGGVMQSADGPGQLANVTLGDNSYTFRAVGTGDDARWEGATAGLFFNPTLGDWRIMRLSGTDAAWNQAPYELDASYP